MNPALSLFAPAPKGLEGLLLEELEALGAAEARETVAGVSFAGDLELAYRTCLWSRLASRVLLRIGTVAAGGADELYRGALGLPWEAHVPVDGTLAVQFTSRGRGAITHSRYGAQKVKDAVVDRLREISGRRPSVDTERPDLRLHAHLERGRAELSIDLSGESLHRRGYRLAGAEAPLKENLAAAILLRAGWPRVAGTGGALLDPMCGSGTLLIEGALMAADSAPGLGREYFGFTGWLGHRPELWDGLLAEAARRRAAGLAELPPILGFDADARAIEAARANAGRAGLAAHIRIERRVLERLTAPPDAGAPGLVVANPPYGERLGDAEALGPLYATLGARLREHFTGWRAAVFTGNPELGKRMGLRARRMHTLYNGALECRLLHFSVEPRWFAGAAAGRPGPAASPGARMFANRLSKNLATLGRWARREGIACYRLYDADMPEYKLAVDLYQGERRWVHAQEYEAPGSVDPRAASRRRAEALAVLPEVLDADPADIHFKTRRRQRGAAQYEREEAAGEFVEVGEGGLRFLVKLGAYLDTGLFLDHRITRGLIRDLARGRRFLNLFGYTATATVYAAAGGASATITVDLSATYLDWARRNLELNGFRGRTHALVRADCLAWLAAARADATRYGLIFLDPPSFSNSKRMREVLDVQRDHVALVRDAAALLEPGGVLLFSANRRDFRLDERALADLAPEDISRLTLPRDFARNPRIHRCWRITRD